MSNLKNSVQLIGNLGQDPEVKLLDNGRKLAKINIATSDSYKNSKGEKVTTTEWHNCVAWGKTADLVEKMLKKGNQVILRGKLTHSSVEDESGNKRYYTQVFVNEFVPLSRNA